MLYPDFEELLQLGYKAAKLDLSSRRKVKSIVSGDHRSPFRGKGLEFEEVREYVPGDDVRNIDWRVTARTGRAHLKLFSEERERSVIVCTDVNAAMRFGTRGTFKSIQAARAAALIGWAASHNNNRVGASFFGNVQGGMLFVDPSRSRRSLWQMLKILSDRKDYHLKPVTLEDHLRYLNKAVPSGALVFILSDFVTLTPDLKKRLGELHRRADVVLVPVNDPADSRLPQTGPVVFDNGAVRLRIDTGDRQGQKTYEALWRENRQRLDNIVNSLKLGHIALTTPGDVYADLVNGLKRAGRRQGGSHEPKPAVTTA